MVTSVVLGVGLSSRIVALVDSLGMRIRKDWRGLVWMSLSIRPRLWESTARFWPIQAHPDRLRINRGITIVFRRIIDRL